MTNYTIQQIKAAFNTKEDITSPVSRYVLRPLSFYITFLALRLNMKPNQVTITALFTGIAALFFIIMPPKTCFILGIILYLSYIIFDFTDGNVARVTDSATYYGKFLDGAVDVVIETLLPLFVAIRMYLSKGGQSYLTAGIIAALATLYAAFLLNRIAFYNRWIKLEGDDKNLKNVNPMNSKKIPLRKISNFSTDSKILLLIILYVMKGYGGIFILFFISVMIWPISVIISVIINAYKQLNVHRISRLAVVPDNSNMRDAGKE